MSSKRAVGKQYETAALAYLSQNGYRVLERNYRNRYGEIDAIVQKGQVLVFVEIKYRSSGSHGDPLEAVDARKRQRICRTAFYYYAAHGYGQGTPCRFDVIGIYGDGTLRHVQDAFPFSGYCH